MNRRRFLKYAGAIGAVVGASAVGLDYVVKSSTPTKTVTIATTETLTEEQTPTIATIASKPPVIKNFQWRPTRVVKGKVYDAAVSFEVESPPPITSLATLDTYAPTIPISAYPAEDPRSLQLISANQMPAATTYSANISDLKGGKQYRLTAQATNNAGTASADYETPYVREFANIAKDADILVGACYYPWFETLCPTWNYCHWRYALHNGDKPLLGLYNSTDQPVISKHIDWANGFGISHFYVTYCPGNSAPEMRLGTILNNPLAKDMKFVITYETGDRFGGSTAVTGLTNLNLNDPINYTILEGDFEHIAKKWFNHPSYLTVDGRPAIYIYATGVIQTDIVTPFKKLREHLKGLGFDPYFIGDEMEARWNNPNSDRIRVFDAMTGFSLPPTTRNVNRSPDAVRAVYKKWQDAAHAVEVEIIPSVFPGMDDSYLAQMEQRPAGWRPNVIPRSIEDWKANLEVAKEFVDKSRLLKVVSWNDFEEQSYIEPSVKEGFSFLQTLRETLIGH